MLTYLRPKAPLVSNLTTPSTFANRVWSLPEANAVTGVEFGAALTNQDVASLYSLAAEQFHAKAFTF